MINIAELLKDATEGMKLYSPLFGDVKLKCANLSVGGYPIAVIAKNGDSLLFDKYGRYFNGDRFPDAECLLFPNKDCRTWEGWKAPVEPKFKVGDWIVRGEGFVYEPSLITEIRDYYICESQNGEMVTYTLNDVHKNFHLWTIEGAKDGDILAINWHEDGDSWEKIVIFKKYHAKGVKGLFNRPCVEGYGNTFKNGKLAFDEEVPYYSKTWTDKLQPATKEQRDLLFQKMKEAGYTWNKENNELCKIIEPKFKVGDSLQTGSYFTKILSINLEEERYYCDNRIISFKNQDLWHLVPKPHYDISNFQPFDKVMVRVGNKSKWTCDFFSHYHKGFHCVGCDDWIQCIPYNDDTKHLLGTTDMCDERYINW